MITRAISNIDDVKNKRTLNIFSDASTRRGPNLTTAACYGVVAVCDEKIIEKMFRIHSDTTSNQEEIRGIRGSVRLALKYYMYFDTINIFSDSSYAVGVIKAFNKYRYNDQTHLIYKDYNKGIELANQGLFIEVAQLLKKLVHLHPDVNIYHQKGHVSLGNHTSVAHAADKFRTINKIRKQIDLNLTRYLSSYNDMVDKESRSLLRRTNIYNNYYDDPVEFFAIKKITI